MRRRGGSRGSAWRIPDGSQGGGGEFQAEIRGFQDSEELGVVDDGHGEGSERGLVGDELPWDCRGISGRLFPKTSSRWGP